LGIHARQPTCHIFGQRFCDAKSDGLIVRHSDTLLFFSLKGFHNCLFRMLFSCPSVGSG
jgi:hypothetical protein